MPPQSSQRCGSRSVDRDRRAEHRLLERDVGDDLQVLAARRAGRAAPAAAATERALPAEEGVEQVAEAAAAEHVVDARPAGAADAGLAEAVVAGPLVGIGQHLVGPGDLLEPLGGRRVVRVGVGVQLARLAGGRPA